MNRLLYVLDAQTPLFLCIAKEIGPVHLAFGRLILRALIEREPRGCFLNWENGVCSFVVFDSADAVVRFQQVQRLPRAKLTPALDMRPQPTPLYAILRSSGIDKCRFLRGQEQSVSLMEKYIEFSHACIRRISRTRLPLAEELRPLLTCRPTVYTIAS